MTNQFTYIGPIVAKPRMTQSDKWKHRPIVDHYFAMKKEMTLQANKQGFKLGDSFKVVFFLPMPESWSNKKKSQMNLTKHQGKPDLDNLVKSLCDCMIKNDQTVYYFEAFKQWYHKSGFTVINLIN